MHVLLEGVVRGARVAPSVRVAGLARGTIGRGWTLGRRVGREQHLALGVEKGVRRKGDAGAAAQALRRLE